MTPDKARWIAKLAQLVQPDYQEKAAEAITGIVEMLDVPDRVWHSRQCLEAIAAAKRRTTIPSFADLQSAIGQWCKDNPEPILGIGDERKAGWTQRDHSWLAYYDKSERGKFLPRGKNNLISLLREQCPAVVCYLGNKPHRSPLGPV